MNSTLRTAAVLACAGAVAIGAPAVPATASAGGPARSSCAAGLRSIEAIPERHIAAAWKANDAQALAAQFTPDATFVVPGPGGVYLKNRKQILAYMTQGFAGQLKGVTSTAKVVNARCVTPDVVVLVSTGGLVFPGESEPPADRIGVQTWTVVRKGGRWLAAAYQNARGVDLNPAF
ncbi:SgcJ/EcaC family oxidoreductase [[Actinomadura] parvosata]|uniref:SgcJ/EcaC family oxidoreductase n=1 Tax=[Actinomadura] parvosata TaxID=1955412 RepID=UPI00406CBA2C